MRFTLLSFFFLLIIINCAAQPLKYTAFTVNDGLPSNYVYRCIEDDKGFLWVATDAGVARFDGKHFQVFTNRDGLPDNDVLAVTKEKNGRIWVNCFKQSPAYFDEVQNRFISAKEDSNLAKIREATATMLIYPLQDGGVMIVNEKGCFVYKDKKFTSYSSAPGYSTFLIKENSDGTYLKCSSHLANASLKTYQIKIYLTRGLKNIDSAFLMESADYFLRAIDNGNFYNFNATKNKCFIYSNIATGPIRFKADSISIPEAIFFFGFTNTWLNFYGMSGKIYVFDKKTLKQQFIISGKYGPNALYNDSKGNIWVSTIDKGLAMYKKKQFDNITMPDNFTNTNFISIARKAEGTLLAGNYYGQVLETDRKTIKVNTTSRGSSAIFRQRKILLSQNKIFTFSDAGNYVNYSRQLTTTAAKLFYAKTAVVYNDSIIIVGQVNALQKLNSITEKATVLHSVPKRVTALAKAGGSIVYYGSTDGLYKYDYAKDTAWGLTKNDPLLSHRITALCTTTDTILWVAASGDGVVAVKDDKVIFHITEKEGIINNNARSIMAAGPGQVWLGTGQGISVINYKLQGNKVSYTIQNLSVNDGLTNNVINEMLYQHDTVYAVTADGISIIPANISIAKFNIPVQLTGITINQRDTIIADKYTLSYNQQNIQMQFAGIELSGHFKNLQYTLDRNRNWIDLDENILTIELNSGKHIVQVRAIDVNGNTSDKILTVGFNIATPFWKSLWFWFITIVALQAIIFYSVNSYLKKKREEKLAKEIAGVQTAALEQQAFTSLMNPHFLFNALNSIQHYINLQDRKSANRYLSDFASLIRKNFEAAQRSFIPLEQEIENIKIYLRLEQMRFNDRFSYQINVDENVDADDWMIPTMMLQPFLENALLHGIMPSNIEGKVTIDFKEEAKQLLVIITDNGIGIANSLSLKESNGHKSLGMELIEKRIAALSRFGIHPITINISPATENEKNPGNKIILSVPAGLYKAWLQAQQQ